MMYNIFPRSEEQAAQFLSTYQVDRDGPVLFSLSIVLLLRRIKRCRGSRLIPLTHNRSYSFCFTLRFLPLCLQYGRERLSATARVCLRRVPEAQGPVRPGTADLWPLRRNGKCMRNSR